MSQAKEYNFLSFPVGDKPPTNNKADAYQAKEYNFLSCLSQRVTEYSGDRVGGGGVGRIRRRDRDTWRVRERRERCGMW